MVINLTLTQQNKIFFGVGIYQIVLSPDWYYNSNIKLIDEVLIALSKRSFNKGH